jgi:hypothetical protein
MVDKDALIRDLLGYLSESEVADFARRNDYITWLDSDEDEDGEPSEAQEWADYDPDC